MSDPYDEKRRKEDASLALFAKLSIGEQLRYMDARLRWTRYDKLGEVDPPIERCFGTLPLEKDTAEYALARRVAQTAQFKGTTTYQQIRYIEAIALIVSTSTNARIEALEKLR